VARYFLFHQIEHMPLVGGGSTRGEVGGVGVDDTFFWGDWVAGGVGAKYVKHLGRVEALYSFSVSVKTIEGLYGTPERGWRSFSVHRTKNEEGLSWERAKAAVSREYCSGSRCGRDLHTDKLR